LVGTLGFVGRGVGRKDGFGVGGLGGDGVGLAEGVDEAIVVLDRMK
jgi:hypothetical protein